MMKVKIRSEPTEAARIKVNGQIFEVGDYEHYEGEYDVKPSFEKQKLNTKNKVMSADVEVESISVVETPNNSGGLTVIIGG